jgi:quercetin dioxygenase-like cupin family protein
VPDGALANAVTEGDAAVVVADFDAVGVRARPLALGRGATELTWLIVDPGGSLARHVAGRDQLFVVVEGSGWLEVEGERTELTVGQSGMIRQGQDHAKGSATGMVALVVQAPGIEAPGAHS